MSGTKGRPDEPRPGRVPSGIAGLDTILGGGFLRGGITIIQGRPGAGKTILGNQICFNHAGCGGRALYVTLLAENHTRMLLHLGAMDFFDPAAIPDGVYYISAFPLLEAEGTRGLLDLLRREVLARQASLLVLDGLVAAEAIAGSDIAFKKFIHELQSQATISDCTMFLLTSGGEDAELATAEHTMVDCVIQMRSRLYGWRAARDLEVVKRRGAAHLRGRHAFRIGDAGLEVFPRIEALLARPSGLPRSETARAPTGLPRLDDMIEGGFPRASSTVLMGPGGSGKTTLGLHFLGECGPEEPGLFFGCYEMPEALRAKARALGLPFADLMDRGEVDLLWQPTTEGLLDELCARLLDRLHARRVRRLFLDGLGGLVKLAGDPERIGHILTAFANELRALEVTSVFTQETLDLFGNVVRFPNNGPGPGELSSVADNLLLFRFVELRSRLYRTVTVMKARDSRVDARMRAFEMTDRGIVVDDGPERAEAVLAGTAGLVPPEPALRRKAAPDQPRREE